MNSTDQVKLSNCILIQWETPINGVKEVDRTKVIEYGKTFDQSKVKRDYKNKMGVDINASKITNLPATIIKNISI